LSRKQKLELSHAIMWHRLENSNMREMIDAHKATIRQLESRLADLQEELVWLHAERENLLNQGKEIQP